MPTLPEILRWLQFINYETVLLGLFITAGTILITRDWRFLIFALLIQYILEGVILSRLVRPDIAVLHVMIGAFICPILFLSARQVYGTSLSAYFLTGVSDGRRFWTNWRQNLSLRTILTGANRSRDIAATGVGFRIFTALLFILLATTLSQTFPLRNLEPSVTTAIYWLILAGLAVLTLTENPIKVGLGLLTVLTGFGILYATLETSLLLTGLWGTVNLLIALAVGYLTVVKGAGQEEEF